MLAEDMAAVMGDTAVAGHGGKHAAAGHVKGGHGAFRARGGRGRQFVGPARGRGRYAGRGYYRTRGGGWGGYYGYPYMDIPAIVWVITVWATAIPITGITVTAPVGTMIHITDTTLGDIILTATDTGRP